MFIENICGLSSFNSKDKWKHDSSIVLIYMWTHISEKCFTNQEDKLPAEQEP